MTSFAAVRIPKVGNPQTDTPTIRTSDVGANAAIALPSTHAQVDIRKISRGLEQVSLMSRRRKAGKLAEKYRRLEYHPICLREWKLSDNLGLIKGADPMSWET